MLTLTGIQWQQAVPLYFMGATYTTDPLTANTTYYVEAVSNSGGCISTTRSSIQVTINNTIAVQPQVNAADLNICQNNPATIHVTNPDATTVYNWYTTATGGSPIFTGTAYTTAVLSASTTYYVEAVSTQNCSPSTRLAATVTVVPQPTTPVPTNAAVTACTGSPVTLTVSSPQLGITYNWYDSPSKTNLLVPAQVIHRCNNSQCYLLCRCYKWFMHQPIGRQCTGNGEPNTGNPNAG